MTPTDADLDDALRRLPTPPPAPAFWQRLDAALAASDEQTANTEPHIAGGSADVAVIDHRHHPARRQQLIAAAAALVALLVTASVITGRDHRRHPAGAQRPDSVLTDRRAISLDPWLTGAPEWPPNGAPQFLIFDVDRLPGGWTASQVGGGASLYPIADLSGVTYQWHAVLTDREGRQLLLVVSPVAPVSISPPSTNDVRGHQASWENSVLSWEERPGVYATLTTYAAPTGALAEADVVALARLLSPIEATGPAQPSQRPLATPDDAGFSGTINGHPWYAVLQTRRRRDARPPQRQRCCDQRTTRLDRRPGRTRRRRDHCRRCRRPPRRRQDDPSDHHRPRRAQRRHNHRPPHTHDRLDDLVRRPHPPRSRRSQPRHPERRRHRDRSHRRARLLAVHRGHCAVRPATRRRGPHLDPDRNDHGLSTTGQQASDRGAVRHHRPRRGIVSAAHQPRRHEVMALGWIRTSGVVITVAGITPMDADADADVAG